MEGARGRDSTGAVTAGVRGAGVEGPAEGWQGTGRGKGSTGRTAGPGPSHAAAPGPRARGTFLHVSALSRNGPARKKKSGKRRLPCGAGEGAPDKRPFLAFAAPSDAGGAEMQARSPSGTFPPTSRHPARPLRPPPRSLPLSLVYRWGLKSPSPEARSASIQFLNLASGRCG